MSPRIRIQKFAIDCIREGISKIFETSHVQLFLFFVKGRYFLRPVKTGNVWRPNIIKHCLVTKHADVEVSGQKVKSCLIKHRIKLHTQRTMGHKLTRVTFSARDFSLAERETSQVVIQMFKLMKSIATIILLEILEENGKKRIKVDEGRPGAG